MCRVRPAVSSGREPLSRPANARVPRQTTVCRARKHPCTRETQVCRAETRVRHTETAACRGKNTPVSCPRRSVSRGRRTCVAPATQVCWRTHTRVTPNHGCVGCETHARAGPAGVVSDVRHTCVRPRRSCVRPKQRCGAPATRCRRASDTPAAHPRHTCVGRRHTRHGKTPVWRTQNIPEHRPRRCGVGTPTHARQAPTRVCRGLTQVCRARDARSPAGGTHTAHPRHMRVTRPNPRASAKHRGASVKHARGPARRCVVGCATHARQAPTQCVAAETHRR